MLFIAFAALGAIAVWSLILLRHGSVYGVALLTMVCGIFAGPPFFSIDGPMQISVDRVMWCFAIGMFVVHWKLGRVELKKLTRGDWLVIGLCVITLLSSLRGGPGPVGEHKIARWLFYLAMPVGIYFITRNAKIQKRDLITLFYLFSVIGFYVGGMAICEVTGLHALVFPRYVVDPEQFEFLGRARGPLMNPAANGILITTCIGATLAAWRVSSELARYGLAIIFVVELLGAFATLTRCVWMGVLLFLGLMIWLALNRTWRITSIVSVIIVALTLGPVAARSLATMKRDKHLSAEAALESVMLRPILGVIAWEMFKERPLVGHGYGRYLVHHKEYVQDPRWEMPLKSGVGFVQHNIVLSILVDCGLVGVAFYVGMLVWWGWMAFMLYLKSPDLENKSLGQMMIAALLSYAENGMFQDATIFQGIHALLMLLAGIMVSVTWSQRTSGAWVPSSGLGHLRERKQTRGPLLFPGTLPAK